MRDLPFHRRGGRGCLPNDTKKMNPTCKIWPSVAFCGLSNLAIEALTVRLKSEDSTGAWYAHLPCGCSGKR